MRKHWKKIVALLALMMAAFGVGRLSAGDSSGDDEEEPGVVADGEAGEEETIWTCPMHPQIQQDEFGTCPICHMDLVPAGASSGNDDGPAVHLSEGARRMARVQNGYVERGSLHGELEVFGTVEVSENAEVDLTAWTGGRIEALRVTARGEEVRRGQLLARIYSPELLAAQRTLLQARENAEEARAAGSERRLRAAEASLEAARTELRLLGVDSRQIRSIEESGQARETLDVFATASGTVQSRYVSEGDFVQTGDRILSLAALDTVWVQLEIFERDLHRVAVGAPVTIQLPGSAGEPLEGRVDFIAPEIDRARRVARARVVLANPEGHLRPGMYVTARLEVAEEGADLLSVPRSAVLWTGPRSLVYVFDRSMDPPGYVPRPVELGPAVGDRQVILSGLEEAEEIAIRGAFRIDASLQIQGGPTMMSLFVGDEEFPEVVGEAPPVEVEEEGTRFDPPIDPARLPDGVWYCDMGTTHWAQPEKGDDECPVCGMRLTEKEGGHDHDH